jgi:hypothetical protein
MLVAQLKKVVKTLEAEQAVVSGRLLSLLTGDLWSWGWNLPAMMGMSLVKTGILSGAAHPWYSKLP